MTTKSKKRLKIAGYFFLTIFLLLIIGANLGIKKFENYLFEEKSNFLKYTSENKSIPFIWGTKTTENHFEPHVAILIPVKIKGLKHKFYVQFDTGSPYSYIYEKDFKSLKKIGFNLNEIEKKKGSFIDKFNFLLNDNLIKSSMFKLYKNYGNTFDENDTIRRIKIGTIGSDFLDNRITAIDFKNQTIQFFNEKPNWMKNYKFNPFKYKGRRILFPVEINKQKLELIYDSGCSAFGLITSKNRYVNFTEQKTKEINYVGKRWGDDLPIHHKESKKWMKIGNERLTLIRVSYVDMYANFQHLLTPFTKIGGWLGNKPFLESTLIIDTKNKTFYILKN